MSGELAVCVTMPNGEALRAVCWLGDEPLTPGTLQQTLQNAIDQLAPALSGDPRYGVVAPPAPAAPGPVTLEPG